MGQQNALATLAVQNRKTSRYLLFDEELRLCGRRSGPDGKTEMVRPSSRTEALAFAGIHVISPRLIRRLVEEGAFSIIDSYLRLASEDEKSWPFGPMNIIGGIWEGRNICSRLV